MHNFTENVGFLLRASLFWSSKWTCFLQKIKDAYHEMARAKCAAPIKEYAECFKASGMMAVVKCRSHLSAMNQCLARFTEDDELYQQFKKEKIREFRRAERDAYNQRMGKQ